LPAQVTVLTPNRSVDLMGTGGRRPVDVAVLEIVEAAVVTGGVRFIRGGIAQGAAFITQTGVLPEDGAMDFVRSGGRRPHDESAVEEVVATVALPRRCL